MFVPDGHTPFSTMLSSERNLDMSKTDIALVTNIGCCHAVIFSLRTYLYPISEIKAAGYGESLSQAIDGLQNGNSPGIYEYKKCNIWGEAIKTYLRK
ncbi:hypothetical protein N7475_007134 [Penicillium sp. IBT 31633x]|nr:hypothetical protein N7475_007134 [Penicillium sp. IBT 31633x]